MKLAVTHLSSRPFQGSHNNKMAVLTNGNKMEPQTPIMVSLLIQSLCYYGHLSLFRQNTHTFSNEKTL